MLFDTHAHITSDALYSQVEELLKKAKQAGVSHIMNICTDKQAFDRGVELAASYPWVYNAAATTPHDVETLGEDFEYFAKAAKEKKLKAIGETGLDYYYEHSPKDLQQQYLVRYMQLSLETKLPLIIHCREAFKDLFSIADHHYKLKGEHQKLLLHCYTGTLEEAKEALNRGFVFSFSGIVTFKKSRELQEVARYVPLGSMVIETDAPYLSPLSKRGQTNEPSFIRETAEFLAELKGIDVEEFAQATTHNAKKFFLVT